MLSYDLLQYLGDLGLGPAGQLRDLPLRDRKVWVGDPLRIAAVAVAARITTNTEATR